MANYSSAKKDSYYKFLDFQGLPIKPVYLLYGEEHNNIQKSLTSLLNNLISSDARVGNMLEQTGRQFDPTEIVDFCNTVGFLFNQRVVIVENCHLLKSSSKYESEGDDEDEQSMSSGDSSFLDWMESEIPNKPEFTIIFVYYENRDKKQKVTKTNRLYKFIQKFGSIYHFPLSAEIFKFAKASSSLKCRDSLIALHKFLGEDPDVSKLAYQLMPIIRKNYWEQSFLKIENITPTAYNRALNHYIQTLDIENRLRPREQDMISEDPQFVLEQWILNFD